MQENNKTSNSIQKKDFSTKIKENWLPIFISLSFIIVIISLIIRNILPEEIPIQENTWNGITPGYSKYEQLVEKMGVPIDSVETKDGFEIKYQSEFLAIPNKVETDKEGTVQFIKEFVKYDSTHNLSQYIKEFGKPDLVLSDRESGISLRANVFLTQGLVIMAHVKDGSVEQKWYFTPIDQKEFLSSWGKALSLEAHGPEGSN